MPLYEHYCHACEQVTEHVCRIDDRKQFVPCAQCGGSAERVVGSAVLRNEPTWLESAKEGLHAQDRHMITDRTSLQRYLKKEGFEQVG